MLIAFPKAQGDTLKCLVLSLRRYLVYHHRRLNKPDNILTLRSWKENLDIFVLEIDSK